MTLNRHLSRERCGGNSFRRYAKSIKQIMEVFNYGINQSKQEGNYPLQSCGDAAEGKQVCQVV